MRHRAVAPKHARQRSHHEAVVRRMRCLGPWCMHVCVCVAERWGHQGRRQRRPPRAMRGSWSRGRRGARMCHLRGRPPQARARPASPLWESRTEVGARRRGGAAVRRRLARASLRPGRRDGQQPAQGPLRAERREAGASRRHRRGEDAIACAAPMACADATACADAGAMAWADATACADATGGSDAMSCADAAVGADAMACADATPCADAMALGSHE